MEAYWKQVKSGESEYSYSCYLFDNQLLEEPLHAHDRFELVFFIKGTGKWQIDVRIGQFRPGSVFLISPGLMHGFRAASSDRGIEAIVVHFPKSVLPQGLLSIVEAKPLKALLEAAKNGLVFEASDPERIRYRLQALLRSKGMFRIARLHVLLELVALQSNVQDSDNQLITNGRSRSAARLAAVRRYLEENCDQPIGRSDAAAFLKMDEAAFSRFFHQESGVTFTDFIAKLRVQKAARWLTVRKDFSIAEVARRSGFRNLSSFNRQFKNRLGMTPKSYRKAADIEPLLP